MSFSDLEFLEDMCFQIHCGVSAPQMCNALADSM